MKYVMFRSTSGRLVPVIFPNSLVHLDIAQAISMAVGYSEAAAGVEDPSFLAPISAGFIHLVVVSTEGESETLKMKSSPEDARNINVYDYTGGVATGMEELTERLVVVKSVEHLLEKVTPK